MRRGHFQLLRRILCVLVRAFSPPPPLAPFPCVLLVVPVVLVVVVVAAAAAAVVIVVVVVLLLLPPACSPFAHRPCCVCASRFSRRLLILLLLVVLLLRAVLLAVAARRAHMLSFWRMARCFLRVPPRRHRRGGWGAGVELKKTTNQKATCKIATDPASERVKEAAENHRCRRRHASSRQLAAARRKRTTQVLQFSEIHFASSWPVGEGRLRPVAALNPAATMFACTASSVASEATPLVMMPS